MLLKGALLVLTFNIMYDRKVDVTHSTFSIDEQTLLTKLGGSVSLGRTLLWIIASILGGTQVKTFLDFFYPHRFLGASKCRKTARTSLFLSRAFRSCISFWEKIRFKSHTISFSTLGYYNIFFLKSIKRRPFNLALHCFLLRTNSSKNEVP